MAASPSKERILARIREGLNKSDKINNPPSEGKIFSKIDDDEVVAFAENFNKTAGKLIFCSKKEDFFDKLFEFKQQEKLEKIYCWGDELSTDIQNSGIDIITDKENFLKDCEAGITLCESLVARTGSIMLSSRIGGGRSLSIFPPTHIVVAYTSQVVKEIEESLIKVSGAYERFPSMISLTSGPSRTADIEKTLVMGAHGPKELILFLIDDSEIKHQKR